MPSSKQERADLVTVAIADSTRIHTQLLAEALHKDNGLQVVASATNSADLLAAVTRVPIDVAIVSHALDDQPARGIEVVREMRNLRPHIKGVLLLDSSQPQEIVDCFRAGAKGIFCKNERLESLSKCIRTVHDGQIWARSADLDLALEALATAPVVRATNQKGLDLLTARERQVIQYLAAGMTNCEIAGSLGLSHHTIKNYLFRIFDKLGVSNRTELLSLTINAMPAPGACTCGEEDRFSCVLEAAESGMVSAQVRLAEQCSHADGHPPDIVSAYMWYLLAEQNSCSMYERIERGKNSLSRILSSRQQSEAERKAAEWLESRKKRTASVGPEEATEKQLAGAD
jgi:DNA-binding NarL/FixJ family response regulator